MDSFEEEVRYFNNLVCDNIQLAKTKKKDKAAAVFFNFNVKKDGKEIAVYNQAKDLFYTIFTKDIETFNFEDDVIGFLALAYIERLTKYTNNQMTFEELADIPKETEPVVKMLLKQKNNISEQLKLLRSNRNIPEVQNYIEKLQHDKFASPYIRYLIDRYYYNKKDLIKPEKDSLDRDFKLSLRYGKRDK